MRVDKLERPLVVQWTALSYEPLPNWVGTTLSFDITPDEHGGSTLTLKHTGLTPHLDCYSDCSRGWEHFMACLKSYVDLGHGTPDQS